MKILSIETSCDETGIAVLGADSNISTEITILGNALASQIDLHAKYGGVFPALAKRAHAEKLVPLLSEALNQTNLLKLKTTLLSQSEKDQMKESLEFLAPKENMLQIQFVDFFQKYEKPEIDYIAVTVGPGLEPALWVGVNAARALSIIWNIPIIPINHMEGHIVTAAIEALEKKCEFLDLAAEPQTQRFEDLKIRIQPERAFKFTDLKFPAISLLISGGHTELVLVTSFGQYQKIGQTRDDAVGEAFDKVARMIGLPYPGGPGISRLARNYREKILEKKIENIFSLPRPMIHSGDYDFSFSGIKTAALYAMRDHGEMSEVDKEMLSAEFEDAVTEVLLKKTLKAIEEYQAQSVIVGGGVASNTFIREEFTQTLQEKFGESVTLYFPEPWLATDNAIMIGLAAISQIKTGQIKTSTPKNLVADGNLSL